MTTHTALIVLGMHRSGTSAMAGVLNHLGVEFGSPLLMPQEGVNDKGFWEHQHIVNLHQRILQSFDLDWYDIKDLPSEWLSRDGMRSFQDELKSILKNNFTSSLIWAVKDPRLCRLLPLWFSVLEELKIKPKFILTFRSPFEVALSLSKRDNYDLLAGLILWRKYFSEAIAYTEKWPRIIVNFDDLIRDWVSVAAKIQEAFSLEWPKSVSRVSKDIEEFLEPTQKHWKVQDDLGGLLADYFPKLFSMEFCSNGVAGDSVISLESSLAIEDLVQARIDEWSRYHKEYVHAQSVVAELNEQINLLTDRKFGLWLLKRTWKFVKRVWKRVQRRA